MGQAKSRGTFSERKAAAVERDKKARAVRAEIIAPRPSPKLSKGAAMVMAVSAAVYAQRVHRE
jgi:hypothetical protein